MLALRPWFAAVDVCRTLGLSPHNGSYAHHLGRLGLDELTSMSDLEVKAEGRGMSIARLVSESGPCDLVLRSDKPIAREFQDWGTRHVLPVISPQPLKSANPGGTARARAVAYERRATLEAEKARATASADLRL